MDRHLKERLVGAAILVILAVLLIPEFLSGPVPQRAGPEGGPPIATVTGATGTIRTYRVDLEHPASGGMVEPDATPVPDHGSQPVPATQGSTSQTISTVAAPPHEAPHRVVAPAAPSHPAEVRGGWWLQLGSFANKANAERLARTLRAKGVPVLVTSTRTRHRVRSGPFADRAAAERAALKLRAQGQASSIVPP